MPYSQAYNNNINPSVYNGAFYENASITGLTNGFYQCTLSLILNNAPAGGIQALFVLGNDNPWFIGSGSGIVFWQPQLAASSATPTFGFGQVISTFTVSITNQRTISSYGSVSPLNSITTLVAPGMFELVSSQGQFGLQMREQAIVSSQGNVGFTYS